MESRLTWSIGTLPASCLNNERPVAPELSMYAPGTSARTGHARDGSLNGTSASATNHCHAPIADPECRSADRDDTRNRPGHGRSARAAGFAGTFGSWPPGAARAAEHTHRCAPPTSSTRNGSNCCNGPASSIGGPTASATPQASARPHRLRRRRSPQCRKTYPIRLHRADHATRPTTRIATARPATGIRQSHDSRRADQHWPAPDIRARPV